MKSPGMIALSAGLILAAGLVANAKAQGRGYFQDDPYYRSDRNRGGYYDDAYRGDDRRYSSLIEQVISDLDRVAANRWLDSHEIGHVNEAARKLQEFEQRWARGNFDNGKLDKAIENIQHLANADQVRGRDRDILSRDLAALRQFRSTRGYSSGGSGYYRNDGYNRRY